jgi:hypothetical protein
MVPTIGEELEGEKKTKRSRSEKVSNKNKNLDHDKAKKVRKPVAAKRAGSEKKDRRVRLRKSQHQQKDQTLGVHILLRVRQARLHHQNL